MSDTDHRITELLNRVEASESLIRPKKVGSKPPVPCRPHDGPLGLMEGALYHLSVAEYFGQDKVTTAKDLIGHVAYWLRRNHFETRGNGDFFAGILAREIKYNG